MRVLFWPETFWPNIGGAEVWATKLLVALRERDHEPIVVTRREPLDLPEQDSYDGIPVYRLPFCTALANRDLDQLIGARQRVAELKSTFAPDLVHASSIGPSILFHLDTARVSPVPTVITLHGVRTLAAAGSNTIVNGALKAADWVVGCSAAVLDRGRQLMPEIIPRSSVIHNALERPSVLPKPLPFSPPRLLCLGRLERIKGFDVALRAFAAVVARVPHARMVIAGEGPERPGLEQQVAKLGLGDVVEFTGWITPDAVPALINTATVVVMPSRSESLPLVGLQAALMARPTVATRVGGLPELVVDQETGLLVPSEDDAALAEAILGLLHQPDTAREMGLSALARVTREFSWKQHVDAYERLYRDLHSKERATRSAVVARQR